MFWSLSEWLIYPIVQLTYGTRGFATENFLREMLKEGTVHSKDVWKEAAENKISERTLKRTKANLGVISRKSLSGWTMELPDATPF